MHSSNNKQSVNVKLTKEDLKIIGGFAELTDNEMEEILNTIYLFANLILEEYGKQ